MRMPNLRRHGVAGATDVDWMGYVMFTQCYHNQPRTEQLTEFACRFYGLRKIEIRFSLYRDITEVRGETYDGEPFRIPFDLLCQQYRESQVQWVRVGSANQTCTNPREL